MMISGLHRPRLLRGAALDAPVVAPVIRTPRLVLRPHRMDDADAWLAIEADPSIRRNLHWPERDQHHALAHLRDRTRHTMLLQSGDFLALAVELDGEVIGDVSVHLRTVAPETRSAELGWLELSRFGGRGYATEAAEGMLGFVFGTLGARWVTAVIDEDNIRSIALAKRLGFECVAHTGPTLTFLKPTVIVASLPSPAART
ncbi:GNAT family N-acetyltransferase [Diaminobutyricibacter sp. McL0618]|uniref:GNAT family N-acetyltransferase n=1 Tax=Leifsonia sp. McL0618 TaxID=3415677 RepID=UPI003CEDA143